CTVSVLVIMTVAGDTAAFEAYMAENKDLVEELTERAKAQGCVAHRFGIADGEVVVVDEWDTAEHFHAFISAPELQAAMRDMGAQGEPRISFAEAKGFPGEF